MDKPMDSKVPYTVENMMKCMCGKCPVQADSKCAKDKFKDMGDKMKNAAQAEVPKPEDVPGIYCSTGVATCKDLDPSKPCICYTCPLWTEYDLQNGKPLGYFCKDGKAI
jgi:hypothetical protein